METLRIGLAGATCLLGAAFILTIWWVAGACSRRGWVRSREDRAVHWATAAFCALLIALLVDLVLGLCSVQSLISISVQRCLIGVVVVAVVAFAAGAAAFLSATVLSRGEGEEEQVGGERIFGVSVVVLLHAMAVAITVAGVGLVL